MKRVRNSDDTRAADTKAGPSPAPNTRNTRARRDRTRREILEAAIREFSERGYFQVSTRDIARRAGVATGLPYRYFESKQALAIECIELGDRIWQDCLKRHMAAHPPATLVGHMVEHMVCVRRFLAEDDLGIWRFYKRHVDRDDVPFLDQLTNAGDSRPAFDHALDRSIERGEIREDVPRDLAQYIVDMVYLDLQETLYRRYGCRDFGLGGATDEAGARAIIEKIARTALAGILR
jgi:AcrR family transcriptional regulator